MIHVDLSAGNRGEPALQVAQKVLSSPEMEGLELYSFKAAAKRDRLYVRIDKVGYYGCYAETFLQIACRSVSPVQALHVGTLHNRVHRSIYC